MNRRVIVVLMIGRSRHDPYIQAPITIDIIRCDVCGHPSRPLFFVPELTTFRCTNCVALRPA